MRLVGLLAISTVLALGCGQGYGLPWQAAPGFGFVTSSTPQTPTALLFSPPGPVQVQDDAASGTPLAGVVVNTSDAQPFTGSVAITSQSVINLAALSSSSLPSTVQVNSISPADDGNQFVTAQACGNSACQSGTLSVVVVTSGGGGGGDPTVGLLPSNRSAYENWKMAGLNSIGGIPNRTTIFTTLSPTGGDDTAQINTALHNCPSDQVVLLSLGVFKISAGGIRFNTSNCTLRGSGTGTWKNTGVNPVNTGDRTGSYVVDSAATQLVKTDRATNNEAVIYVLPNVNYAGSINLTADAMQGATTLSLASAPSPALQPGDIVLVDMNTDNDADVVYGPSFGGNPPYNWPFMRASDRSLSQLMEVQSASGTTVTFSSPFTVTFTVANSAQLTRFDAPFVQKTGIENLFVWGGEGGDFHGNIAVNSCAYCWVKGVESTWAEGTNIGFYGTFRSVLRDSFIHETPDPNPGGAGYLIGLNSSATENLIENNISWYGNKEIVARASGGGNVIAYNYMDDSFDGANPQAPEAGINTGHFTTPHMELLEGNYSQNYKGDSYWGNSIYIAAFRNWFSGLRAAHPPLAAYTFHIPCGGGPGGVGTLPYGDYQGRTAVDVQAYSFYTSFVGNVLGMSGQITPPNPFQSQSCFGAVSGFSEQVWLSSQGGNTAPMWQFGAYQASVNTPPCNCWTWVDSTINTQLRQGNWDWVTHAQHWYGIGGTTDGAGGSPVTIPNSFYLSAKPAFFGTNAWPWVDPTTGATAVLPAKYCFEHSQMPTCLQ